jgi:hypothetical protein
MQRFSFADHIRAAFLAHPAGALAKEQMISWLVVEG